MVEKRSYFTDYYISGKNVDEIFQNLSKDRPHFDTSKKDWKQTYVQTFGKMFAAMPNPRKVANEIILKVLEQNNQPTFDPENTYLNKFGSAHKEIGAPYYTHEADSLEWSYRVTDAVLLNILGQYYADDWDVLLYDESVGLYKDGEGHGPWGPHNIIPIMPIEIYNITYYNSILTDFHFQVEEFWKEYNDLYCYYLADHFLVSGINQYKNRMLSEAGFGIIRKAYDKSKDIQASYITMNTYASTDIILLKDKNDATGLMLLYIPGASLPFMEFMSSQQCRIWVKSQIENDDKRRAFANHFSIYNRQDGLEFSGVDTILEEIAKGNWDLSYIGFQPIENPVDLFETITGAVKERMKNDGKVQIKSNSALAKDQVLNFIQGLLSQLTYFEALVPEILIPLNLGLSLTAVGLSVDKMIEGASYEEKKYGVGEFVTSLFFVGFNMIPFFAEAAVYLKSFALPVIPAEIGEKEAIESFFNVDVDDITIGSNPVTPGGELANKLFLVRLADEQDNLAVIRPITANKYSRLHSITHEDIQGYFISRVYNADFNQLVYVSNGRILGGAPNNPLELDFEGVMSIDTLKRKAAVIGKPIGESYSGILSKTEELERAVDFDDRSEIAMELIDKINKYKIAHPNSGRISAFEELKEQLLNSMFTDGMNSLINKILIILDSRGSDVASWVYLTMVDEIYGIDVGKTGALVLFIENDYIAGRPFSGFEESIPENLGFEPHFVIPADTKLSALDTNYYEMDLFEGMGFTNNLQVFKYVLENVKSQNFLTDIAELNGRIYIGYDLDEINHIISNYSFALDGRYLRYPLIFKSMLHELGLLLTETSPEIGFIENYITRDFYVQSITERLSNIEDAFLMSDNFDFSSWDSGFPNNRLLQEQLEAVETPKGSIEAIMNSGMGSVFDNSEESIKFITNNLEVFHEVGVRNIYMRDLNQRLLESDISSYFTEREMSNRLDAALLTLDRGRESQPYRNLFMKASDLNISIVPTGGYNAIVLSNLNEYETYYGYVAETLREFGLINDSTGRFLVIAPRPAILPIEGILAPFPNIAELTYTPAVEVSERDTLRLIPLQQRGRLPKRPPLWTEVSPPKGRIVGWKTYGGPEYVMPDAASRRALLLEGLDEAASEQLEQQVNAIKNEINDLGTASSGTCAEISGKVKTRLANSGYNMGRGLSIAYWKRIGYDYEAFNHTATSVWIGQEEFIVDATHLQFPHGENDMEYIVVMRPEHWVEEIANRTKAIRPWVEPGLKSIELITYFEPPIFTKPRKL